MVVANRRTLITALVLNGIAAFAQTPEFAAATVKMSPAAGGDTRIPSALACACQGETAQVAGPLWIETGSYDIFARSGSSAGEEQLRRMLQKLPADRYQPAFHRHTRGASTTPKRFR